MDSPLTPASGSDFDVSRRAKDAEHRLAALSSLLESIDRNGNTDPYTKQATPSPHESHLALARLGMASSLFIALRARHSPTAAHCLRVALGASSWAMAMNLPEELRDDIEIASLLHDVGKIGVPDHVLSKPGKLTGEELLLMERHRQLGCEIISGCCSSGNVLNIVQYSPGWYDGTKHGFDRKGEELPLGSRIIAIVDAFDAMTTDSVYRRAMSRERAVAELFAYSGSQFDPQLVTRFCELISQDKVQFTETVARRWLQQISVDASNRYWSLSDNVTGTAPGQVTVSPFYERLLDCMHDGVVFVDEKLHVTAWNRAIERLTGIPGHSIIGNTWTPDLIRLKDERGIAIAGGECPIGHAMEFGTQSFRRLTLFGRNQEQVSVDVHIAPVLRPDGVARRATVILHDASSQITLEERVESLSERATQDPLTKLSNRSAEFDHGLKAFVKTHLEHGEPCSMIMCDIDHFKKINDVHGHQAGDDALIRFAGILQGHARDGDLVARYGGEEFVVLCADCDNATATRRAEALRRAISEHTQPSLGNKSITASFGVTEIQGGDTPETFLNRTDRALLQAKDNGRNMVVQLGTGIVDNEQNSTTSNWLAWFRASPVDELLSRRLVTVVPMKVAAEKLRGFIADHQAQIIEIRDNHVTLKIDESQSPLAKRWTDRPVPFVMELTFDESNHGSGHRGAVHQQRTMIHVVVRPRRQRDRRRRDMLERARQLLVSLKSYLMAHDFQADATEADSDDSRDRFLEKSKKILTHWLSD